MNKLNSEEINNLMLRAKIQKPFELIVSGTSMLPVLREGDTVQICGKEEYEAGDILVFLYKENEVLVHRLLKIEEGRYFCKGDNSFRLEDIAKEQIIGVVILEKDPHRTDTFLKDSYQINRIFRRCKYDIEETKKTPEYLLYRQTYLRPGWRYEFSPAVEVLEIDEENLAIYDSDSGDVHYIDETGKSILDLIGTGSTEEDLIVKLCEMYHADKEEIIGDVRDFLDELMQKKVILCC